MNLLTSPFSAGIAAYTLNLLLHLTVISLGVLAAAHGLFRRDPAARHLLCMIGLVCLLLTPVAVGLEAKAGYGLIKLALPGAKSAAAVEVAAPVPDALLVQTDKPYRVAIRPVVEEQAALGWPMRSLTAIYLLGVGWGLMRFFHGCRKTFRLQRHVSPWNEPAADATLKSVEETLSAPLPPVFTSRHVASPIAVGLLRPAVILPEGLSEVLSPRQLRHVLLHECAHITLRHSIGGLLERLAGVLFWPHPLVRLVCRELARAREEMCDNVASQEDGAACYARTLLTIAQGIECAPNLASTLALLGPGVSLEARIAGLLDPRRNRMVSVKRWKLWAVTGTTACVMASTAAIRVVAAQDPGQNPGDVQPANGVVSRVFPMQYVDASQAADLLRNNLPPQQLAQIALTVDSRTNSLLVQSNAAQVAGISVILSRLEAQAEQEYRQRNTPPQVSPVPGAPVQPSPVQPVQPARQVVPPTTAPTQTYSVPLSKSASSGSVSGKSTSSSIKSQAASVAKSTPAAVKAAKRALAWQQSKQQRIYSISVVTQDVNRAVSDMRLELDSKAAASITWKAPLQLNGKVVSDKQDIMLDYRALNDATGKAVESKPLTFKVQLMDRSKDVSQELILKLKDEEALQMREKIAADRAAAAQDTQDAALKVRTLQALQEKIRYDIALSRAAKDKVVDDKAAVQQKLERFRVAQDLEAEYQKLDQARKDEAQRRAAKQQGGASLPSRLDKYQQEKQGKLPVQPTTVPDRP